MTMTLGEALTAGNSDAVELKDGEIEAGYSHANAEMRKAGSGAHQGALSLEACLSSKDRDGCRVGDEGGEGGFGFHDAEG